MRPTQAAPPVGGAFGDRSRPEIAVLKTDAKVIVTWTNGVSRLYLAAFSQPAVAVELIVSDGNAVHGSGEPMGVRSTCRGREESGDQVTLMSPVAVAGRTVDLVKRAHSRRVDPRDGVRR